MSGLKLLALAIIFVVSGGILFAEYFRSNKLVRGAAAVLAIVATAYLAMELKGDIIGKEGLETGSIKPTPPPVVAAPVPAPGKVVVAPLAGRLKSRYLSFSADGTRLHIVTAEGPVLLWDRKFNGVKKTKLLTSMTSTAVSSDRQLIAEVSWRGAVNTIDLRAETTTAVAIPELPIRESISKVAISSNGGFLAIASYTTETKPKGEKGEERTVFKPHLRLFNLKTRKQICHDEIYHSDLISDLAFSHDGKMIITASWDSGTRIFTTDCNLLTRLRGYSHTNTVTLDVAGKRAASGAFPGIRLYKQFENYSEGVSLGFSNDARRLAFDPRGLILAAGDKSGWVYLFDPATGVEISNINAHSGEVTDLAFSPDAQNLATLGQDGIIIIWEVAGLKRVATLHLFADGEWAVLLENGEFCGSRDVDRWLRLRTVRLGRLWNSNEEKMLSVEVRKSLLVQGCQDTASAVSAK
jgi:WD40 repeat protein